MVAFVFFKQKPTYVMRISDWSSDVCSSDLKCFRTVNREGKPFFSKDRDKVLAEFVAILRADLDPRILPVENLRTKAESASQEVACRHGLRFHDREAPETRLRVILRVGKQITAVRDFGQFNLCPVNWVENVTGCGELRQRRLKHGKAEDVDLRVQVSICRCKWRSKCCRLRI